MAVGLSLSTPELPVSPCDGRTAPRTNLFIAAVLHSAGDSCPVRLRNLSPSGALVETPVPPQPDAAVALVRGRLRATGIVAWTNNGRCGIRFNETISVTEWMAGASNPPQAGIDRIVTEIRSGIGVPTSAMSSPPPPSGLRDDIDRLRLLLRAMGDDLTGSPETLVRHAASLQHLDIAEQMLGALVQAVDPDPEVRRMGMVRLHSLRRSGEAVLWTAA